LCQSQHNRQWSGAKGSACPGGGMNDLLGDIDVEFAVVAADRHT
jgi:hypothetical protein